MSDQPIDMRPDHEALVRDILLAHLPKGVRVWVFGSRATWRAKPYSDLDLALEASEPLPDDLVADLADDFKESDLPWKVDVLDLNAIAPSFRALIDKGKVGFLLGGKVMGEWANHRLADVIELIGGGTPKRSCPDYWGGDIPWLSVKDFNDDNRYVCSAEETITEEGLNNSSAKILKPGQVIISARGTVGALAQIARPMAFNQSCYGISANTKHTMNDYIFYLLQDIVTNLQNITHGAVFDTITRDTFQLVDIKLPPLSEQRAIAAVLGSLDDKIELNRRMNETLEAMARAIFKDWFVDFGPTRAKAEGREPYLASEVWALFPDRLDEEGKPEGWTNDQLGTFTNIKNGFAFKSKDWRETGTPVVKIGSVKPAFVDLNQVSFIADDLAIDRKAFRLAIGDMLVGLTGYVGETGRVPPTKNCPMLNQRVGKIEPQNGLNPFVFAGVRLPEFKKFAESKGHGSAQANVSTKDLLTYPLSNPGECILGAFCKITAPFFEKSLANMGESRTLAQIRDLLLPKLMSGEIRVRDAEKAVEAVA